VAGFVVRIQDGAVDPAADLNPLAEGVVVGGLGGGAVVGQILDGVVDVLPGFEMPVVCRYCSAFTGSD
jgi:hypothetical protein